MIDVLILIPKNRLRDQLIFSMHCITFRCVGTYMCVTLKYIDIECTSVSPLENDVGRDTGTVIDSSNNHGKEEEFTSLNSYSHLS